MRFAHGGIFWLCGAVAALALVLSGTKAARAQPAPPDQPATTINVDLFYTVSLDSNQVWGLPGFCDYSVVRSIHLEGDSLESASVTLARTVTELSPFAPGGLMFDVNGRLLIACGRNAVVQVNTATGQSVALPGCEYPTGSGDPPRILDLAADPASDRAWMVMNAPTTGALTIVPEFAPGIAVPLTGSDQALTDLAFTSIMENGQPFQRVIYAAEVAPPPGSTQPPARCFGFLNTRTGHTTRLAANVPAARALALDPFTGHLFMVGSHYIAQVDVSLVTPQIIAMLDLSQVFFGGNEVDLVDATADGRGRLFAVSSEGRLIVLDFSELPGVSAAPSDVRIDHRNLRLRLFDLEPGPPAGWDRTGYPSIRGLAPLSGPGRPRPSDCLWDNGAADRISGQLSQFNPDQGNPESADDLYLEPGHVYRLDSLTATLATNSVFPTKATLTIYEDCDGKPGAQISRLDSVDLTPTDTWLDEYRLYLVRFYLGGMYLETGRSGRTLWVSVRGVGLGSGNEEWFWATADNGNIKGSASMFRSASLGYSEWTAIEGFGCGCSDFAFTLRGERCKILLDGGLPDLSASPPGSLSQIASDAEAARTADDLVISPGDGPQTVCYIRAYIYSNCTPVRGRFELYANACGKPAGEPGDPIDMTAFARITDTGYTVAINGVGLTVYVVEAYGLNWVLHPGRNYWIAPVGDTTFARSKRTYAAFGRHCDKSECVVRFRPAHVAGRGLNPWGDTNWRPAPQPANGATTPRDLAMLVAIEPLDLSRYQSPNDQGDCPADIDSSGQVTLQDLFTFLQAWFAGCP